MALGATKKQHEQFVAAAEQMRRERDEALSACRNQERGQHCFGMSSRCCKYPFFADMSGSFREKEKTLVERERALERSLEKAEKVQPFGSRGAYIPREHFFVKGIGQDLAEVRRELAGERGVRMQMEETCRRQVAEIHREKCEIEVGSWGYESRGSWRRANPSKGMHPISLCFFAELPASSCGGHDGKILRRCQAGTFICMGVWVACRGHRNSSSPRFAFASELFPEEKPKMIWFFGGHLQNATFGL